MFRLPRPFSNSGKPADTGTNVSHKDSPKKRWSTGSFATQFTSTSDKSVPGNTASGNTERTERPLTRPPAILRNLRDFKGLRAMRRWSFMRDVQTESAVSIDTFTSMDNDDPQNIKYSIISDYLQCPDDGSIRSVTTIEEPRPLSDTERATYARALASETNDLPLKRSHGLARMAEWRPDSHVSTDQGPPNACGQDDDIVLDPTDVPYLRDSMISGSCATDDGAIEFVAKPRDTDISMIPMDPAHLQAIQRLDDDPHAPPAPPCSPVVPRLVIDSRQLDLKDAHFLKSPYTQIQLIPAKASFAGPESNLTPDRLEAGSSSDLKNPVAKRRTATEAIASAFPCLHVPHLRPVAVALFLLYTTAACFLLYSAAQVQQVIPEACNTFCLPWFAIVFTVLQIVMIPLDVVAYRSGYQVSHYDALLSRSVMLACAFFVGLFSWTRTFSCVFSFGLFASVAAFNFLPLAFALFVLARRVPSPGN